MEREMNGLQRMVMIDDCVGMGSARFCWMEMAGLPDEGHIGS
jgi:hypothetical protein